MQPTLLCLLIHKNYPLVDVTSKTFVKSGAFYLRSSSMLERKSSLIHDQDVVIVLYYGINSSQRTYTTPPIVKSFFVPRQPSTLPLLIGHKSNQHIYLTPRLPQHLHNSPLQRRRLSHMQPSIHLRSEFDEGPCAGSSGPEVGDGSY
jgi:hypothetical protein